MVTRAAKGRLAEVVTRLKAAYPQARCALTHSSPWELLVATILSAQCTDETVNKVTPKLFAKFPSPAKLSGAKISDVEAMVRSTGFYHSKAKAITAMSQDIVVKFGGEIPKTMEELVTLRGVGRKTANVVLGVAFGIAGFPVDTHVTRLTGRLGLTKEKDPVKIEKAITADLPPKEWTGLSLRLIEHGRKVCIARAPRCPECVLLDICPTGTKLTSEKPSRKR
jgi:endonuclease-3